MNLISETFAIGDQLRAPGQSLKNTHLQRQDSLCPTFHEPNNDGITNDW